MNTTSQVAKPFVGREAQLGELHKLWRSTLQAQQLRFGFVSGEFGVGKTALVERFLSQVLEEHGAVLVGRSNCSGKTEDSGYLPLTHPGRRSL